MWGLRLLLSVFVLVGAVLCYPQTDIPGPRNYSSQHLSHADRQRLTREVRVTRLTYPATFKKLYVNQNGSLVRDHKPSSGYWLEVVGSPLTPMEALYVAARSVSKMLRHSLPHMFERMAIKPGSGLGIFTLQETLAVFPELASLDDPDCHERCDGSCSHTCTFDGRKFATLGAITVHSRSYSNVDNVMCTARDPFARQYSTVVHEFAHSVERLGLSLVQKSRLTRAYNNALTNQLWRGGSYAMGNRAEYWAEATGVFFLCNIYPSNGGMSDCPGHTCRTEQEARGFLHDHDLKLWTVLADVYTQGHASQSSGLTMCPDTSG